MWSSKQNKTEFEWQCAEYTKEAGVGIRRTLSMSQNIHDFPMGARGEYTEGLRFPLYMLFSIICYHKEDAHERKDEAFGNRIPQPLAWKP